jgi:hypothetical protein
MSKNYPIKHQLTPQGSNVYPPNNLSDVICYNFTATFFFVNELWKLNIIKTISSLLVIDATVFISKLVLFLWPIQSSN